MENPAATEPLRRRRTGLGHGLALIALLVLSTPGFAQIGPRGLAGRWSVALTVDSSAAARTATVSGTMVLVAVERAERPTFRGSYQIPFRTIGLSPDAAPALAWIARGDSVRVVLNPDASSGHAELSGAWVGGTIQGRWRWIGRPGGEGKFTLRPLR